ncbi:MAG: redoxin family protein [Oligoflexus sp.]
MKFTHLAAFVSFLLLGQACSHSKQNFTTTDQSVSAGAEVTRGGSAVDLFDGDLAVGKKLPDYLPPASQFLGSVAIVNVVPSIDTAVCEEQTHQLGESKAIDPRVQRVVISRDLPMAQARFAKAADLENITYLSDYKQGEFGRKAGLLMQGSELLARAVLVVDREGIVRHLQIVPEIGHMPNLEKAIGIANQLAETSAAN